MEIREFRGISNLVYAKVLKDDSTGYVTGPVKRLAGASEISKTTENSTEAHYYDNYAAINISSRGSDEVTLSVSALDKQILAELTGQYFDETTGAIMEGFVTKPYFAIGYLAKKDNGDLVYVWRYKGTFNIPDETFTTENDGTDANGQELTYTGIRTTYEFENCLDPLTGLKTGANNIAVEASLNRADLTNFFANVTTPDTIVAKTANELTITEATDTTVTVLRRGETLETGADIYVGDVLTILCVGGTLKVNNVDFTSGNSYIVAGDTTVVSTASI